MYGDYYFATNHNYNKILKSDWLSTALISNRIGLHSVLLPLLMCQQNNLYSLNIAVLFHFRRNHLLGLPNGENQKLRGTLW